MLSFIVIGALLVLGIWLYERKTWRRIIRSSLISCVAILLILTIHILRPSIYLQNTVWYESSPYREIILFIIMISGMFCYVLSQTIKDRRKEINRLREIGGHFKKPSLKIDKWELLYPFFFSFITFGTLLQIIENQNFGWAMTTLAFETGFCWQTILTDK